MVICGSSHFQMGTLNTYKWSGRRLNQNIYSWIFSLGLFFINTVMLNKEDSLQEHYMQDFFNKVAWLYQRAKIVTVQSLSPAWFFATQASLSITISQSLLKLMSIDSMMPTNHLIFYCPLLLLPSIFPSIRVFSNEKLFTSGGQRIGASASASASVLPMNIQDCPLGLTGQISLQSKGLSRVFSSTTIWKHQLFSTQPSL